MQSYPGEFARDGIAVSKRRRRRRRPSVFLFLPADAPLPSSSTITPIPDTRPASRSRLRSLQVFSIHLNADSTFALHTRIRAPCLLQFLPNHQALFQFPFRHPRWQVLLLVFLPCFTCSLPLLLVLARRAPG